MKHIILKCSWEEINYPLKAPYYLSFVTLTFFKSIQVDIVLSNGEKRKSEVVPLPGYSKESEKIIVSRTIQLCKLAIGKSLSEFRQIIKEFWTNQNFSKTAFLSAIDLFDYHFKIDQKTKQELINLIPQSTEFSDKLVSCVEKVEKGTIIKIKLTGDHVVDCRSLSKISEVGREDINLRLDANQAYSLNNAKIFCEKLLKLPIINRIDYLEQPLYLDDWENQEKLSIMFPEMKFMMDEGIYSEKEIELAAQLKIDFVKLKLFKQGGITELIEQSKYANSLGLKTVIGNGVATWLSNEIEISIFLKYNLLFYGVHEANGYLKTTN